MKRWNIFLLFILMADSYAFAAIDTYKIKESICTFTATGKPGFLRINGDGATIAGIFVITDKKQLTASELQVPLAGFTTGIDSRDEHMRKKYLEIEKYPTAVFKVEPLAFANGSIPDKATVKGNLTLHGVTRPIEVALTLRNDNTSLSVEGEFEISLSDYKIDIPNFSGITVAKDVKIHLKLKGFIN